MITKYSWIYGICYKKISCGLASSDMFDPGGKIAVTLTSMIKDEGGSVPTIKIMRKLMYSSNKI